MALTRCPRCHQTIDTLTAPMYRGTFYCHNCSALVWNETEAAEREREIAKREREDSQRKEEWHRRKLEAEAEYAREAQEKAAKLAAQRLEEQQKDSSMKHYTCCRCQGVFREDQGYSALQTPIKKPLCNDCYSSLIECTSCGKYIWKEELPKVSVFYKDMGNGVVEKQMLKEPSYACVCDECKEDFFERQKTLEKIYVGIKCACCGKYIWKEESTEVSVLYEDTEKGVVEKQLSEPSYVCDECKEDFLNRQEALAKTYRTIVASDGSGDFEKISDALKQTTCKKIIVKSGIYREHFAVDREVLIVGEDGAVIWDDTTKENAVVVIDAENVTLENLEIRGAEHEFDKEYSYSDCPENIDVCDWWPKCIYIKKNCNLTHLEVAYSAGHGIVWGGKELNPRIKNCTIKENSRTGVLVANATGGEIIGTKIFGNHNSGMSICCSKIVIKDCEIYQNYQAGIYLSQRAWPTIKKCDIYGNDAAGIDISNESNPNIWKCKIHDGKNEGVLVHAKSEGVIEDCDIYGNTFDGIRIEDESNPSVRNSNVHDGKRSGVFVCTNSKCVIEGCDVYGNACCGIVIKDESNPNIKNCKIHDGKQAGVLVCANGKGIIEDCDIYGNAIVGIEIRDGSNLSIKNSKIHDETQIGVLVCAKGNGIIEDCDVYGNAWSGIVINEESNPSVRGCKIHDGKQAGVLVCAKGNGIIEGCDVYGNACSGIVIDEESNPNIKNCKIHDGMQAGVFVYAKGNGIVEACDIYGNASAGIEIKECSNPSIKNCKIHNGEQIGVLVCEKGKGVIEGCDVYGNAMAGIEIKDESDPRIRNCKIYIGKKSGVRVHTNGKGFIESCDIFGNLLAGIVIEKMAEPIVEKCKIHDQDCGIQVCTNGILNMQDCEISKCQESGISVLSATGKIARCNFFENGTGISIICGLGEPLSVEDSKVYNNAVHGIYVEENSFLKTKNCEIYGNAKYGINKQKGANVSMEATNIHDNGNNRVGGFFSSLFN